MEFNEESKDSAKASTSLSPLCTSSEQKSLQREVNLRKVLTAIKMPTPRDYCQKCFKKIETDQAVCCPTCIRAAHQSCAQILFSSMKSRSRCIYCFAPTSCCLKCYQPLRPSEATIVCSLCWREMHCSCFALPLELFNYSKPHSEGKIGVSKTMVCGVCEKSKKPQLVESVSVNNHRYYLFRMEDPSRCHYTWKTQEQFKKLQQSFHGLNPQCSKIGPSQIDYILGLFVPQSLSYTYSLSELYEHFERNQPIQPFNRRIKLLVKWVNHEQLVWQDEAIVRPSSRLIFNYLRQLSINHACLSLGNSRTAAITSIINEHFHREELMSKLSFIGGGALEGGKQEKSTAIVMSRVYQNYLKNISQSIKSKKEDDPTRAHVLGSLLNTIYFFHKNISPAILFTTQNRIEWWIAQLRSICAYHTVVALYGSEQCIRTRFALCVSSASRHKQIFWFNVMIVPYEQLASIEEIILLYTLLDQFALMVMDQNMNETARHLYQTSKIPKIKMSRKAHEFSSARDFKLLNHSSVPSVSSVKEKSQECFSQGRGQEKSGGQSNEFLCQLQGVRKERAKHSDLDLQKQTNLSLIKHTLGWLKMDLDFKSKNHSNREGSSLLDELQRVVYVRYILAFGMNFQSMKQLVSGLTYLQGSFFTTLKSANTHSILYNYTKEFLSVIYSSKDELTSTQLQQQKYYLFDLPALQIKKRIVFLAHLKQFYQKQHQGKALGEESEEKKPQYLDLMIAQAILQRGYGRWQSVSQYARVWQTGGSTMSLRQFICNRADLKDINISMFCQFLKRRVPIIAEILQTQISGQSAIK